MSNALFIPGVKCRIILQKATATDKKSNYEILFYSYHFLYSF